jgi:hypothetical protein
MKLHPFQARVRIKEINETIYRDAWVFNNIPYILQKWFYITEFSPVKVQENICLKW